MCTMNEKIIEAYKAGVFNSPESTLEFVSLVYDVGRQEGRLEILRERIEELEK